MPDFIKVLSNGQVSEARFELYLGDTYPAGTPMHPTPDAFWLNDGTGRFRLAHFTDFLVANSVCGGPRGAFMPQRHHGFRGLAQGVAVPEGPFTVSLQATKPHTFRYPDRQLGAAPWHAWTDVSYRSGIAA